MKKIIIFGILILIILLAVLLQNVYRKTTSVTQNKIAKKSNMKIVSSAFQNNSKIPSKYTCDGENVNPPLEFMDIPQNAKSLVLIADDPDALSKTWVHWVVYNINSQTSEVKENSVPKDRIEGMTDFGKPGYGGPCPSSGTHRYFFKLYALDKLLDLSEGSAKAQVEKAMQGHILDKAELIGLYSRE